MVAHTGERNFACSFPGCDRRFIQKEHAKKHLQSCHDQASRPRSSPARFKECRVVLGKSLIVNPLGLKRFPIYKAR